MLGLLSRRYAPGRMDERSARQDYAQGHAGNDSSTILSREGLPAALTDS